MTGKQRLFGKRERMVDMAGDKAQPGQIGRFERGL